MSNAQPCVFLKYNLCFIKYRLYFDKFKFDFIKHKLYFKGKCISALSVVLSPHCLSTLFISFFASDCNLDMAISFIFFA